MVLRQCVVKATSAKLVTSSYQWLPLTSSNQWLLVKVVAWRLVDSCVVT